MIDPRVQALADRFVEFWQPLLAVCRTLPLDYSWPSVGTLDVLTFPLRENPKRNPFETFVLQGAAAYLAVLAHQSWATFGAEAEVRISDDDGISIAAVRGPKIPADAECVMYVEHDLGVLLADLPSPMPVISKFSRPIGAVENFLSSFGIGLLTGLSPAIDGPWSKESLESFSAELGSVLKFLAGTCAESYTRMFPEEPLGQVAELYLHRLIFPVTMLDESFPHRGAVDGLMDFLSEFKVPRERAIALARNLALSPDERIMAAGLSYVAALGDGHQLKEVRMIAAGLGSQLGLFRRAMLDVRERAELGGEWLLKTELSLTDEKQIEREIELGYWPWLKMRPRKVKTFPQDRELQEMLAALTLWEYRRAVTGLDKMLENNPNDIELRIERCYLSLVNGEVDLGVRQLRQLMSEPEAESEAIVYKLLGSIDLARGELAAAEASFRRAMKLVGDNSRLRYEIHNDFGLLLLLKGDFYGALTEFDDALLIVPDALVPQLNRYRALSALQQYEDADELRGRLLEFAPTDRAVFSELLWPVAQAKWGEGARS